MRSDQHKAIQLRKIGKSYREITKVLGIPKSTLTYWFKDVKWSKEIKKRLALKANIEARKRMIKISHQAKIEREKLYYNYRKIAQENYLKYSKERLFISGLMIYWGEGDSNLKNGIIRVTNTDPVMLKVFFLFLKKYLPEIISKLRTYLVLYPDLNDLICKNFWSKQLKIHLDKFYKSQYIYGKHPTKRLSYGICTITVTSRSYKEIIISWIDLIKKEIKAMRV